MTGSAADAEDIVQETFARALASPPPRAHAPWRPWLVRVALNLARDELRRRKRRAYKGPWLPEPVDDAWVVEPRTSRRRRPAATSWSRVSRSRSCSRSRRSRPAQRAVLLLRDVFEYIGPRRPRRSISARRTCASSTTARDGDRRLRQRAAAPTAPLPEQRSR